MYNRAYRNEVVRDQNEDVIDFKEFNKFGQLLRHQITDISDETIIYNEEYGMIEKIIIHRPGDKDVFERTYFFNTKGQHVSYVDTDGNIGYMMYEEDMLVYKLEIIDGQRLVTTYDIL